MSRERFDSLAEASETGPVDVETHIVLVCTAWAVTDNGVAPELLVPLVSAGRAIVWC